MENQAVEKVGLIPRSILRTLDRFRQQFLPGTKLSAMREFRVSRQQMRTSVRCLITLILIPLLVNFVGKNFFIKPVIEYFWNNQQNQFFLNSYQENRAFVEMQRFEDRLFFESLIDEGLCNAHKRFVDKENDVSSVDIGFVNFGIGISGTVQRKPFQLLRDVALGDEERGLPPSLAGGGHRTPAKKNIKITSKTENHSLSYDFFMKSEPAAKLPLFSYPSDCSPPDIHFVNKVNELTLGGQSDIQRPLFSFFESNSDTVKDSSNKELRSSEKKGDTSLFFPAISSNRLEKQAFSYPLATICRFNKKEVSTVNSLDGQKGLNPLYKESVFHITNGTSAQNLQHQIKTAPSSRAKTPLPDNCLEEKQKEHKALLQRKFQQKTLQLAHLYNQESVSAITDFIGDIITLLTIRFLFVWMRPQIIILKSFLTESLYSLSDATKSLLIILLTDLLVGYHSPKGWEVVTEMFLRHYGFPENRVFILFFIGTFPVMLDTIFKYWIFRHLNRISPSTVVTYHSMIE